MCQIGQYDTVYTNIKHHANRKIAIRQVNRTCTLNMSLRVAYVSEVLIKSLEENTLMRQGNKKVILKCKLLLNKKVRNIFQWLESANIIKWYFKTGKFLNQYS